MSTALLSESASNLGNLISIGRLDPVELTELYLNAIKEAPLTERIYCECSSGVEHHLAKVRVAGSNPFTRSTHYLLEWWNW